MLPPTDRAAHYHSLRVHLQILKWNDLNDTRNDQAIDWGWKREKSHLIPVMTDKEPAPSDILKIIRCRCKRSCTTMCSCKKNGLKCVKACLNCQGESCDNIECDMDDNFLNELDEELDSEDNSNQVHRCRNIFETFDFWEVTWFHELIWMMTIVDSMEHVLVL